MYAAIPCRYIFDSQLDFAERVISTLAFNSKDPVFLGYPFGLIYADKFARVSNQEREYLRTTLKSKLSGGVLKEIESYENSLGAHGVLDRIG